MANLHAPLLIDVPGLALSAVDRQRLQHPLVGGVVLFGRNWQDRQQLTLLCRSIKRVRPDLLIAVDHEGGRVQRFRSDGFTVLPPMARLGQRWRQPEPAALAGHHALAALRAATACGFVLASELRACGVDLSFTPVLDLDWGRSGVIGDRAFDSDPRVVSLLARALVQGLLQAGMANCGKHFPGHGWALADSHTELPRDARGLNRLLAHDALPYVALGSTLSAVMPAHVVYPKVDPRPAGFSPVWLQRVLRERLGFDGAIFSDDLAMAGARELDGSPVSTTQAALAALAAGCDLVLLCNQSVGNGAGVDALINGLTEAQRRGDWQPDETSERRRRALLPRQHAPSWTTLIEQRAYRSALAEVAALT